MSAESYPQGAFSLGVGFGYTFASKRFTDTFGTDTESIADDYNVTIRGEDLAAEYRGEIVGRTDIKLDSYGYEFDIKLGLGITDEIAFLMMLPIKHGHNSVSVGLRDSTLVLTRDNDGKPVFILPQALAPGDHTLDAQDLQDVLTCEGDSNHPICAFGYDPLETFDKWAIGDTIWALRYRFHDIGWLRQALTLWGKIPSPDNDDIDNLFDTWFSKGYWVIGLMYGIDVFPVDELYINLTVGYTINLPYHRTERIASLGMDESGRVLSKIPIGMDWQKMDMNVDPGDSWELYFGFHWDITKWLSFNNEQYFYWAYKFDYWAAGPVPVSDPNAEVPYMPDLFAMELNTDFSALNTSNAIGINTLPWVLSGDFPVPFNFSVFYTYTIAGKNVEQEHIFGASLDLFATWQYVFGLEGGIPEEAKPEEVTTPPEPAAPPIPTTIDGAVPMPEPAAAPVVAPAAEPAQPMEAPTQPVIEEPAAPEPVAEETPAPETPAPVPSEGEGEPAQQ